MQEDCTVDNVRNRNKLHIKVISRLFPGCLMSVSWVLQLTRVLNGYLLYVSVQGCLYMLNGIPVMLVLVSRMVQEGGCVI